MKKLTQNANRATITFLSAPGKLVAYFANSFLMYKKVKLQIKKCKENILL